MDDIKMSAIAIFAEVVTVALPYAIVFSLGSIVVNTFLTLAFKGRAEL